MSSPNELTLAEARDALKAKTLSARELTQAHLDAMAKARALNAYILETPERALAMADASDAKIASDRKSTRLNSSHSGESRMPSSA